MRKVRSSRRQPRRVAAPLAVVTPAAPLLREPTVLALRQKSIADVLQRAGADPTPRLPAHPDDTQTAGQATKDQMNAAIGCKTSEVALAILAQVVQFEHADLTSASQDAVDVALRRATAMLTELEPRTATEALLAAQMIGTQRTAVRFLQSATEPRQNQQASGWYVLQATRLMRLFNEQADTMTKLKGKGSQQRVVVEHVTVAAGGQAIVGAVMAGGGGGNSGGDE